MANENQKPTSEPIVMVRTVMMSHLSDAQEEAGFGNMASTIHKRLNFVKYLALKFPNITTKIHPDYEYEEFLNPVNCFNKA